MFYVLEGERCVCQAHWDQSDYRDSCANQQGCTDCDESGYTWCQPTNFECDTVERDGNGDSEEWFRCDKGKTIHLLTGITFESMCDCCAAASLKVNLCNNLLYRTRLIITLDIC